jgi:small-conductance mechanosensitive channel
MDQYQLRLIETAIIFAVVIISRFIIRKLLERVRDKYNFQEDRVNFNAKIINVTLYLCAVVITLFIWGVDQRELALFLSSFVAILGIALFAQWSMLSNVTASIILFLNHPAKIGDTIVFLDKDFPLTGKIKNIGAFFITVRTEEDEMITIPNSLIFQKMVKIISE